MDSLTQSWEQLFRDTWPLFRPFLYIKTLHDFAQSVLIELHQLPRRLRQRRAICFRFISNQQRPAPKFPCHANFTVTCVSHATGHVLLLPAQSNPLGLNGSSYSLSFPTLFFLFLLFFPSRHFFLFIYLIFFFFYFAVLVFSLSSSL